MATHKVVSIDEAKEQVRNLVSAMKMVEGFRIPESVEVGVKKMASHIESGENFQAVGAAREVLNAGQAILGAFIRFSVVDRKAEGQPDRVAMFSREIAVRNEEGYDEDILGGLETKRKALEEAVRSELNGTFVSRVEAYNMLKKAVDAADLEQKRRDRVRQVREVASRKSQKVTKDADATALNKAVAQTQREALLAKRREEAEELRNLL